MSRYTKLRRELVENIQSQVKFGESKHEAKKEVIREARENGERFTAVQGIYSYTTLDCYIKETERFARWATERFNCKSEKSAKQYVRNYLKENIERGLSPWTVHTRAFALACAFQCPVYNFGAELPKRTRTVITRSRLHTKTDEGRQVRANPRICQSHGRTARRIGAIEGKCPSETRGRRIGDTPVEKAASTVWRVSIPTEKRLSGSTLRGRVSAEKMR